MLGLVRFSLCGFFGAVLIFLSSCSASSGKAVNTLPISQEKAFVPTEAIKLLSTILQQKDVDDMVNQGRSETDADRVCLEVFDQADDDLSRRSFKDRQVRDMNINYLKQQRQVCYHLDGVMLGVKDYFAKILWSSRYVSVPNFSDVCAHLEVIKNLNKESCLNCLSHTREQSLDCVFKKLYG
jgi:hypothetical protein